MQMILLGCFHHLMEKYYNSQGLHPLSHTTKGGKSSAGNLKQTPYELDLISNGQAPTVVIIHCVELGVLQSGRTSLSTSCVRQPTPQPLGPADSQLQLNRYQARPWADPRLARSQFSMSERTITRARSMLRLIKKCLNPREKGRRLCTSCRMYSDDDLGNIH